MVVTFVKNKNSDKKGSLTTSEAEMMFIFQWWKWQGNMLVGQGFIAFSNESDHHRNGVRGCALSVLQVVEGGTPTTVCLLEEFGFF